jgi:cell wall assembly regulator SMI1
MSIESEYHKLLNEMVTAGGASNEMIEAAERELGVVFPSSYRQFLAKYGAALGKGIELAGLAVQSNDDEPPMWRSIVLVTKQHRRVSKNALANSLIPISDDGQGLTFYIDAKKGGNSAVIAYAPGIDGQIVSSSFEEFVVRAAKNELDI